MSNFGYGPFITDAGMVVAFHAKKYSQEDAFELAKFELDAQDVTSAPAWCYYGPGVDDDGERVFGYWLTLDQKKHSFPVMVFSVKGREWP
jgi:hypothetical protein